MKSTVYIIQAPTGKNLEPAKQYGDLTVMLRGNESKKEAQDKLITYLSDFKPNDFLLLIGSPLFIAIAVVAISQREVVQLLIWDREHQKYNVEELPC